MCGTKNVAASHRDRLSLALFLFRNTPGFSYGKRLSFGTGGRFGRFKKILVELCTIYFHIVKKEKIKSK